jgi:NAD-dependent deacetylase
MNHKIKPIDPAVYRNLLVFTGAGLSAESGVPTYRGSGGFWAQYNYQDYACQRAFDRDPQKVLEFHARRRASVLECAPHAGHAQLARVQARWPQVQVVTQNIDGMLQRAGVRVGAELHGSLWRLRCACGVRADEGQGEFRTRRCARCGNWLRPDITWFEDAVDQDVFGLISQLVDQAEVFISVGTSGAVWPAAGFAEQARRNGCRMIEINPEDNEASYLYREQIRLPASQGIPVLLPLLD